MYAREKRLAENIEKHLCKATIGLKCDKSIDKICALLEKQDIKCDVEYSRRHGISTNVRRVNISQVDQHYQYYLDENGDLDATEKVKKILIINAFRDKPINEREPINPNEVLLAEKYEVLIIEAKTLLSIYEEYVVGKVDTKKIISVFSTKSGVLSISDLE